jgi:hypothetical protein
MPDSKQTKPLNVTERRSTIEEFLEYCAAEKQNRQNSGDSFDAESFDQAVDIALHKLISLQNEGWT